MVAESGQGSSGQRISLRTRLVDAAIGAAIVLLFTFTFGEFRADEFHKYAFYMAAAVVIFAVFIGLYLEQSFLRESLRYGDALKKARDAIREDYAKTVADMTAANSRLTVEIDRISAHANNLKAQIEPHLIVWSDSRAYEIRAERVLCITPNLSWAASDEHIRESIEDVKTNRNHKYQYIICNGSGNNSAVPVRNARKLLAAIQHEITEYPHISENFQILFLRREGDQHRFVNCSPRTADEVPTPADIQAHCISLPLSSDIAVYENTPEDIGNPASRRITFAVIPTTHQDDATVRPGRGGTLTAARYDLKLQEAEQYEPIRDWFETQWADHAQAK